MNKAIIAGMLSAEFYSAAKFEAFLFDDKGVKELGGINKEIAESGSMAADIIAYYADDISELSAEDVQKIAIELKPFMIDHLKSEGSAPDSDSNDSNHKVRDAFFKIVS